MAKIPSHRRKKKKPALSKEERAQKKEKSDHQKVIRNVFVGAGFTKTTGIAEKQFTYDGITSEIDDIFVFENIIVLAEYTCTQTANVGSHLKSKKIVFDKILQNAPKFIDFLVTEFPTAASQLAAKYHKTKRKIIIVYCSRHEYDEKYQQAVPGPVYFDYSIARYFQEVIRAIKKSGRFELFQFLRIPTDSIGVDGGTKKSVTYSGQMLPEAHSYFQNVDAIVSFYADPKSLLESSYVLRRDGWKNSNNLYQRMISNKKINSIRKYLKEHKRVFINNIIVTLPSDTRPLDKNGKPIDPSKISEVTPIDIQIPTMANSIGLIDGQHRVFAYHETPEDDPDIAALRVEQNLLVTGIVYPKKTSHAEKEKLEARLFLELNSNQATAKTQLKQDIGVLLEPFSLESIASRTLASLARRGPLLGFIEQNFYDKGKLKPSSIVSFGLKPLVKISGEDSLFSIWDHPEKHALLKKNNDDLLGEYIDFCVETINGMLIAVRKNVAKERWTTDRKVKNHILGTTNINSFLITLRLLVEKKVSVDEASLSSSLKNFGSFDTSIYKSSQYSKMAEEIVLKYFAKQIKAAE